MERESLTKDPTPEEIEEIKKEAIKLITERINRGDEFLYISEGQSSSSGEAALMIGGHTLNLARVLSITMTKVPQLHKIVSLANEANEYANNKADIIGSLKDLLSELAGSLDLDCETCPKKETCEIKDEVTAAKESGDLSAAGKLFGKRGEC